jgi:hypothetical protein
LEEAIHHILTSKERYSIISLHNNPKQTAKELSEHLEQKTGLIEKTSRFIDDKSLESKLEKEPPDQKLWITYQPSLFKMNDLMERAAAQNARIIFIEEGAPMGSVSAIVHDLEKQGFIYHVNSDQVPEIKLPELKKEKAGPSLVFSKFLEMGD